MRTKAIKKEPEKNRQLPTIGGRLREIRADNLKVSPSVFADKVGLESGTTIMLIEGDAGLPSVEVLVKMAEVYPIDLHWLLTGKPCPGMSLELQALRDVKHRYRVLWAKIASQAVKVTDVEKHVRAILDEIEQFTRGIQGRQGDDSEQTGSDKKTTEQPGGEQKSK